MEELIGSKVNALIARPDQQPIYEYKYVVITITYLTGAFWGIKLTLV